MFLSVLRLAQKFEPKASLLENSAQNLQSRIQSQLSVSQVSVAFDE